jgi:nucleoside 2-deoxyribosyltransferase
MRDYFVYLCGGMGKFGKENFVEGNKWRGYCKQTLETYECEYRVRAINPNDYFNFVDEPPKYNNQNEVMRLDLYKLRSSDLVIANFNDMYSLGSMSEIAIAYDRGIPVIGLNENNQNLHPWQICMCERIFNNIDEMLDYIEDFYLR